MKSGTWLVLCALCTLAALAVVVFAPAQGKTITDDVQICGPNAGVIEAPHGHITCTLKNGKVIHLRSAK